MKKRVFAVLMCLAMTLALVPTTAFAIDGAKTYTFDRSQIANLPTSDLRANVYFKGDTIVFTPDVIEPFTSSDHGVCKTPFVGLSIAGGTDVTGGICSVNTYSSDGSGYMVSFTITSDNPVTLDYKAAGPTGKQTTPDSNNNYYSYRYFELQFVVHPTSYPVNYVLDDDFLGVYGSWPSGANQPTGLTLNGNTGTYELQIPAPQSNDSSYYLSYWDITNNVKILSTPIFGSIPTDTVYPINGVVKLPLTIRAAVTPYANNTEDFTLTAVWSNISRNAAPTFSVDGGTYTSTQNVALSCATEGANIFYTTDGSVPTRLSQGIKYTSPIAVSSTTTIVARAFSPTLAGIPESEAVSETYTISATPPVPATVATPTFSPAGGTFTSAQSVTLSCTTGASIRYTTNGTDPTEESTAFVAGTPITVSSTTTINAKAFKNGMTASGVASATYTITTTPDPDPDPTVYPVVEGGQGAWTEGSASGLTIRVNGDYAKFQSVSVDGNTIGTDKYTSASGSTIITLKASYLESLLAGSHALRVNFTDGYAQTSFTVAHTTPYIPSPSYDYFTITATAGSDGTISPSGVVSVREGRDKTFTITPSTGYVIADVLVDGVSVKNELLSSTYTFENVYRNHTISVTFIEEKEINPNTGAGNPFIDVDTDDWFFVDVMFVYERGLMVGTSETTFEPLSTTTRAMVVTTIWRMDGSPDALGVSAFPDVEDGKWYTDAITWAKQNEIAGGYANGLFGTNDPVTREQLAAFFYRYADYKGYDMTITGSLDRFTDKGDVSAFAIDAMRWAIGTGLIEGKGNNILDPQGAATRAEFTAMLHRFIEKYELV